MISSETSVRKRFHGNICVNIQQRFLVTARDISLLMLRDGICWFELEKHSEHSRTFTMKLAWFLTGVETTLTAMSGLEQRNSTILHSYARSSAAKTWWKAKVNAGPDALSISSAQCDRPSLGLISSFVFKCPYFRMCRSPQFSWAWCVVRRSFALTFKSIIFWNPPLLHGLLPAA